MEIFTGILLGFHCRLIKNNETTNEHLKDRSRERNYIFREASCFGRLKRALSCSRRTKSIISNDLIRVSILIESLLDFESLHHSVGGTPKKAGEPISLPDEASLKRKIETRSRRKAS